MFVIKTYQIVTRRIVQQMLASINKPEWEEYGGKKSLSNVTEILQNEFAIEGTKNFPRYIKSRMYLEIRNIPIIT